MPYSISWIPAALEDLRSLDKPIQERIVRKIRSIEFDPLRFAEHLVDYELYKLRVGDYRAIIDIKPAEKALVVILVGHREKVYKLLARRFRRG